MCKSEKKLKKLRRKTGVYLTPRDRKLLADFLHPDGGSLNDGDGDRLYKALKLK